jgi:hypothetical protein
MDSALPDGSRGCRVDSFAQVRRGIVAENVAGTSRRGLHPAPASPGHLSAIGPEREYVDQVEVVAIRPDLAAARASTSCAEIRTRSTDLRTLPSSTYPTPLRRGRMANRIEPIMHVSVMRRRIFLLGSRLRLTNGSTAIDGFCAMSFLLAAGAGPSTCSGSPATRPMNR